MHDTTVRSISAFHPALYVYTRPMNEFKVNLNMDMTTQY